MRVTSNLFSESFKSQLQYLQERQMHFQNQISTGLKISKASDSPVGFQTAQIAGEQRYATNSYLNATGEAIATANYVHEATTDLQRLMSRAYEIGMRCTNVYAGDQLKAMSEEMTGIISQVADVANRQKGGTYLFGGTSNQASITVTSGTPTSYAYNAGTNSQTMKMEIAKSNTVEISMLAGRPGAGGFSGFLVPTSTATFDTSAATSDIDALSALINLRDTLSAGQPIVPTQNSMVALKNCMDKSTEFVGKSAARLAGLTLNQTSLKQQLKTQSDRVNDLTNVSLADAVTDLQKVQLHYEGAIQAGAKVLSISLLDYIR